MKTAGCSRILVTPGDRRSFDDDFPFTWAVEDPGVLVDPPAPFVQIFMEVT